MSPARKRAASPAFQFYVGDFMTGTSTMSPAEVGGYLRLLLLQWAAGSVPGDDIVALARAMVCDRVEAEPIWCKIRNKFRTKKGGVWINLRLEKERKKQDAFRKLQSDKGKRRAALAAAAEPGLSRKGSRKAALHSSPSGLNTNPLPPKGGSRRKGHRTLREVSSAKPEAIRESAVTRARRAGMAKAGMTPDAIEAQLHDEYLERKAATA